MHTTPTWYNDQFLSYVRTYVRTESAIKKADFGVENGQIKDDGAGIRVECGAVYSSSIETTMDLIEGAKLTAQLSPSILAAYDTEKSNAFEPRALSAQPTKTVKAAAVQMI